MKSGILKLTAVVAVMLAISACASTRTQQSAGEVIDDSVLTSKAKLIEDPNTKAYRINVDTQKGIVQLSGFVASSAIRSRAGELALSVNGVVDVKNGLEIRQN